MSFNHDFRAEYSVRKTRSSESREFKTSSNREDSCRRLSRVCERSLACSVGGEAARDLRMASAFCLICCSQGKSKVETFNISGLL